MIFDLQHLATVLSGRHAANQPLTVKLDVELGAAA